MNNTLKASLLLIPISAVVGFLMFRHEPGLAWSFGGMMAITLVIVLATSNVNARSFILKHGLWFRRVGMATGCAGFIVPVSVLFLSPQTADADWTGAAMAAGILVGVLLFLLPKTALSAEKNQVYDVKVPAPAVDGRDLLQEARASIRYLQARFSIFLRLTAPWLALAVLLPLAILQLSALRDGYIGNLIEPVREPSMLATPYVCLLVIWVFATPSVAVAWHRYVLLGEIPRWGFVPLNKRFWRYFYRIWIFGFVTTTIDRMLASNASEIAAMAGPGNAGLVMDLLSATFWLFAVWVAAMFALVLPAVAVDDKEMDGAASIRHVLPRRFQFATGLVMTILLFFVALEIYGRFVAVVAGSNFSLLLLLNAGRHLLILMGVATSATYLSQTYQRLRQPLAA